MMNELMVKLHKHAIPFEDRGQYGVLVPNPNCPERVLFSFLEKEGKIEMVDHRYSNLVMYGKLPDIMEYVDWNYED